MTPIAIISMSQLSHYQKCMSMDEAADDHDLQLPLANIPSKSVSTPAVPVTTDANGTNFHGGNTAAVSYAVDGAKPASTVAACDLLGQPGAGLDGLAAAAQRRDQSGDKAVMDSTARAAQEGVVNGNQRVQ